MKINNVLNIKSAVKFMVLVGVVTPNLANAATVVFSRIVEKTCSISAVSGKEAAKFGVGGVKVDGDYVELNINSNTGSNNLKINDVDTSKAFIADENSATAMAKTDFRLYVNDGPADEIATATAKSKSYTRGSGNYKIWLTTTKTASELKTGTNKVTMTLEANCS